MAAPMIPVFPAEIGSHLRPKPRDFPPYQGISVGANRLGVRRNRESRIAAAHLVVIHVGLRQPVPVHEFRDVLRLDQVEREAVTVVVVARVLLIEPRQARGLVPGSHVFHVPVRDHLRAVGIDRGKDDADDVVQHAHRLLVISGEGVVNELRRGL